MESEIFQLVVSNGQVFKGRQWLVEEAQANLAFMSGMMEHAARYQFLADFLNGHGVNVYVLDHLGQGLNAESVGQLQVWPADAFSLTIEAMEAMRSLAISNGLPTVIGGHSMGSIFTQAYLQKYPRANQKAIIMGSMADKSWMQGVAYRLACITVTQKNRNVPHKLLNELGIGAYEKAVKPRKTDCDWLSYNEENVQAYIHDSYCGAPNTGGFWQEFLKGTKEIWRSRNWIKVNPTTEILLIAGQDDPVGRNGKAVERLAQSYKKTGVKSVRLCLYPNMRHEILNEEKAHLVHEDLLKFILEP